jgi:uncharacterized OB-fold protein
VIVALIVAIALPRALRDEKRLFTNRCLHCGYDLRESAERCPECGRPTDVELPAPPSPPPAD